MVLGVPHAADRTDSRRGNAGCIRGDIAAAQVGKLGNDIVSFTWCSKAFPAKPQIEGQAGSDLPVVLSESRVIVSGVVAVSVGLVGGGNARVNGRFHKVRVIAREIRVRYLF